MPFRPEVEIRQSVRTRSVLGPGCVKLVDADDSPLKSVGEVMQGFIQGADRQQTTLLPECLDDWVDEGNSSARSMCLVMRWNCATSGSMASTCSDRPAGVPIFADAPASTSTVISTGPNRAGGWSARLAAISR